MDFYFGVDLLHHLQRHYEQRLSLALSKSFNQTDSRYYWLFKELECRVTMLRKLLVMISALPGFMCRQTEEQVFAMVVSSTSSWFSDDVLGDQPKDAAGNCSYYQESNPYWVDYQLAMDRFTPDYDYTNLAAFYVDLVEYLVMTVRLYFFIREQQFRPIDRGKFDPSCSGEASLKEKEYLMMNKQEMQAFRELFSKYCRQEINKGHCESDGCEFCSVNSAYDEIFNRFSDDEEDDTDE